MPLRGWMLGAFFSATDEILMHNGEGIGMENRLNILFFLTPKEELAYVYEDYDVSETLAVMEGRRYAAIPVLKDSGEYLGTITEGDLLWAIKNGYGLDFRKAMRLPISSLPRRSDNRAVTISTDIDQLFAISLEQNFVPVVDDRDVFIGIVTRRNIIRFFRNRLEQTLGGPLGSLLWQSEVETQEINSVL